MFRFIEANECPKDSTKVYVVRYYLQQMFDPETTPIEERWLPLRTRPFTPNIPRSRQQGGYQVSDLIVFASRSRATL